MVLSQGYCERSVSHLEDVFIYSPVSYALAPSKAPSETWGDSVADENYELKSSKETSERLKKPMNDQI